MPTTINQSKSRWLGHFWSLAWPISLQSVLLSLLGLVDVMMVANLGEAEVAAVGYAGRSMFVAILVLAGFATAASILCAQHWGRKDWSAIGRTLGLSLALGTIANVILLSLFFTSADNIMSLASTDAQLQALGIDYIYHTAPMLLFVLPIILLEAGLRASGETRLPLYVSVIAVIANIGLNQVLIFGVDGLIEPMGIVGAGVATVIARALQLLIFVVWLAKRRHPLLKASAIGLLEMRLSEAKQLIKLATPLVVNFTVWSIGVFAFATLYGRLGTQALAAISLISPLEGMAISCFMGFSSACSILIGNKLGASEFALAWRDAKRTLLVSPIAAIVLGFAIWSLSKPLMSLFGNFEPETLELANQLVVIMAATVWLRTLNMVLINGVLRSGGDNNFCLMSDVICQWGVGLLLTSVAILVFEVSLVTAFCIALSEEVVKCGLCYWRMHQKKWLRNLVATPNQA
ncbi:MATE family efflux transporter [Alginatibacterium sediminis]|uniref:MATE family efflux transporter n=1 Tax=Alginatibacterium sediminis TaxID=2164068 RepID=A0A420E7S0_9ALTE|nr:MATE family efflux transporter [Alginatibacterium sediminis]RKF14469.1 MATE family efflux transporter [Alginatibacterium sediminis]